MLSSHGLRFGLAAAICAAISGTALAGSPGGQWRPFTDKSIQDHGYEWATVGRAGNADWVGLNSTFQTVRVGGVDHRYRIAKTEVTNRQWFEFVQAYAPYVAPGAGSSFEFTGRGIALAGGGGYSLPEATAEHGAEVGWRFAARYLNWLHNDMADEPAAFESGVYDTSTFGPFTGGFPVLTDQPERSEGARYFLPTNDEWIKAVHFDPNRFGDAPGSEGYWLYTYSANTAPVAGAPGVAGTQTNAGTFINVPIMSYPEAETPWGLFDASGSALEWLETLSSSGNMRLVASSDETAPSILQLDRISQWSGSPPHSLIGIRLASVVPGPGISLVALSLGIGLLRRRHRTCSETCHPPCSG